MPGKKVSEKTIKRLSHYARCLRKARADRIPIVTSKHLSDRCGISSAAVRKDLAIFGEFGKQGSGYGVSDLLENIERILGTCEPPAVIVIGAGNIGSALLESGLDGTGGYSYSAIFDKDPNIIGKSIAGVTVQPLSELRETLSEHCDVIAILAVSPGEGQNAVNNLVSSGCISILSFTLEPLEVPGGVVLRYVEVSTELDILTHSMKCRNPQ